MRNIFSILLLAMVLVFSLAYQAPAADKHATTPSVLNHLAGSTINVTFAANSDSTGSQHTYPIFIGNINDADAYVAAVANAAADFNVIYHFSNDLTRWKAVTSTTLDAVSNTAKYDTLGAVVLADFHEFSWMVIESDGQTGTNSTDILYMSINFQADVKQPTASGEALKHAFYNPGGAITDP